MGAEIGQAICWFERQTELLLTAAGVYKGPEYLSGGLLGGKEKFGMPLNT